uniref:Uncharacterized protein n=1 Tax=Anguilla anguilla TaxID=7936 RepID=A0A0E9R1S7_ANGAN
MFLHSQYFCVPSHPMVVDKEKQKDRKASACLDNLGRLG